MQRAVRAGLGIVTGLMTVVLLAELVCRVLPVSTATVTGYHLDPLILTYPSGHRFRTATGWDLRNAQTLQANNLGFVSDVDFVPDPQAVALIGDSYVEASMLPSTDRLGPQLQRHLGDRPVYAMGGPGSSLLDYAERIRLGSERLGVRDFVVFLDPATSASRCAALATSTARAWTDRRWRRASRCKHRRPLCDAGSANRLSRSTCSASCASRQTGSFPNCWRCRRPRCRVWISFGTHHTAVQRTIASPQRRAVGAGTRCSRGELLRASAAVGDRRLVGVLDRQRHGGPLSE